MKKKIIFMVGLAALLSTLPQTKTEAQIPVIDIITAAAKKIITALDLKVQQLQNQTIWLQNAEKQLENKMALGNLNDISGWLDKEKILYADYYKELQQVKQVISDYDEVKRIIKQQAQLVNEYKSAYTLFKQDKNFSSDELNYMGQVYNGILQESIRNLDEVLLAVNAMGTQMTDGQRLQLINKASSGMQKNVSDLRQFNNNNKQVSLQRAKDKNDKEAIKQLYGINN